MLSKTRYDTDSESLLPVVEGMGYTVVECKSRIVNGTLHVFLVIYRDEGINLDHCTEVYKALYPRLEVINGTREVQLEVSSPGINRNFKSQQEFGIFQGQRVRVLLETGTGWIKGVIADVADTSITVETSDGTQHIDITAVRKAQLVYV